MASNGSLARIATQLRITDGKKTVVDANNCGEILTKIGLKLEKLLTLLMPSSTKEESEHHSVKKFDCNYNNQAKCFYIDDTIVTSITTGKDELG